MRGGFGSLAQQGFLTPVAGREQSSQANGAIPSEKIAKRAFPTHGR